MKKSIRKKPHSDPVKYVAYVLWLIGHSERAIGVVLNLRRKQVAGIIARSEYAGRSFMRDGDRKEKLKELEDIRFEEGVSLDGGLLDNVQFQIIPLSGAALKGPLRRRM